jgi:hypothetical protein
MIGLFYADGFAGKEYILRVGDVAAITNQLAHVNDLRCLVRMGRTMGPKSDQPQLDRLEAFLDTCEDRKGLEEFQIKISTGKIGCVMCAETSDEVEQMGRFVVAQPEHKKEYHEKLEALFDRVAAYISSGEKDDGLYALLSGRQHILSGVARDDYLPPA